MKTRKTVRVANRAAAIAICAALAFAGMANNRTGKMETSNTADSKVGDDGGSEDADGPIPIPAGFLSDARSYIVDGANERKPGEKTEELQFMIEVAVSDVPSSKAKAVSKHIAKANAEEVDVIEDDDVPLAGLPNAGDVEDMEAIENGGNGESVFTQDNAKTQVMPLREDRSKPIYAVYKEGIYVEVPTWLQWEIRDLAETYEFNEKYIFGMITTESTFHTDSRSGNCKGLAQIDTFWVTDANMPRFTENWYGRDLYDPHLNLLTLMEMWCYARDAYGLDTDTELGMIRLLYWHNTGDDPCSVTSYGYATESIGYASELIKLQ